jgi:hypothetical protein
MPRPLTTERRQELDRLKNARAIREAIYDAAILIGAALLYDDVSKLWPQSGNYIFVVACGLWVGAVFQRYRDWKAISFLEQRLTEDEIERVM